MGVIEIVNKQKYEEGFEIGIKQGFEIGIEQGIEIAHRKAYEEVKRRVDHMRQKGLNLELIADFLLLSREEVIAFFNDLDNDLLKLKKK
jgi:flagellar biosynthesis/type III secretory pathway protein FliH